MKTPIRHIHTLLLLLTLSAINHPLSTAFAQGTAFTYQGRLNSSGSPANGLYDFRLRLDGDPEGNTILDTMLTNAIPVTNGLFTTTINFGAGWFNGSNYWLEVDVRTNNPGNTLAYTSLTPYQSLTPTPYAVFANTASNVSGTVSAAQLSGPIANANLPANPIFSGTVTASSLTGNGANLTSLNANNLASGTIPLAQLPSEVVTNYEGGATLSNLTLNGELILPDAFSGGADIILSGYISLMYADNNFNFCIGIGTGSAGMSGGANTGTGYGALRDNQTGAYNTANGDEALEEIRTSSYNTAYGALALAQLEEGGDAANANTAVGYAALFNDESGKDNTAVGSFTLGQLGLDEFVSGGGTNNIALGYAAGYNFTNDESGNIDIGNWGQANENFTIRIGDPSIQTNTFIAGVINGNGGGLTNLTTSVHQLTGSGNNNVFIANAGNASASGPFNTANGWNALLDETSGSANTANGAYALQDNTSGSGNTADGAGALEFNSNGQNNTADGVYALQDNVSGSNNTAVGYSALIGRLPLPSNFTNDIALGYQAGSAFTNDEANNIDIGNIGVAGDNNTIRIGTPGIQTTTFIAGVINGNGGGLTNVWQTGGNSGTTAGVNYLGTADNQPLELHVNGSQRALRLEPNGSVTPNVIGGSGYNFITSGTYGSTIAGGGGNNGTGYTNSILANANFSAVGGGGQNTIGSGAPFSTIAGGSYNTIQANAFNSVISGGVYNTNAGAYATIAGGEYNIAGQNAFAGGYNAQATNTGAFVWSDGTGTLTTSTNNNSVTMRAGGGYRFFSGTVNTTYAYLAPGSGSWTSLSDRNAKEHFQAVNPLDVLEHVAVLPVSTWNYKTQPASVRHIGPTAQDFKAAFTVGETDTGISTVDEGGVALAAIQGLNQKLNEKDAEIQDLKQSVDELKKLVQSLSERK